MTVIAYQHPESLPRCEYHQVSIDGVACDVLSVRYHGGQQAGLVIAVGTGRFAIEISNYSGATPSVKPLALGIEAQASDGGFRIEAEAPCHLMIEQAGAPTLFCCVAAEPAAPGPDARCFAAGQVHEVGELEITSGQEIFIEGGAVLRGAIRARGPGCKIRGHGIIDGSCFDPKTARRRSLILDGCHDGIVEGVSIINPSSWCCVLGACDRARVTDLRAFGDVVCSDGIDLCGCRDTVVENCLLVNNDDCVAIKAADIRQHAGSTKPETSQDWRRDISNIEVRDCVLVNGPNGNAVEIGGETSCDTITDVRYHDLDILYVHGFGSPFSLRICDRAQVSNIRYENIRVEHHWHRMLNMRIFKDGRYSLDSERGSISDVIFKNIDMAQQPCNLGNTDCLIGGYDEQHRISNVHFDHFMLGGKHVLAPEDIDLLTRAVSNIRFS